MDDIRLSEPVSQTGTAASVDARLVASDVGSVGGLHPAERPVSADQPGPDVPGLEGLQMRNVRLDRFLPPARRRDPLTVNYSRTGINPELLTGTDIRGDALPGLRKPDSWSATDTLGRPAGTGNQLAGPGASGPAVAVGQLHPRPRGHRAERGTGQHYTFTVAYQMQGGGRGSASPRRDRQGPARGSSAEGSWARPERADSVSCPPGSGCRAGSAVTSPTPPRSGSRWPGATTAPSADPVAQSPLAQFRGADLAAAGDAHLTAISPARATCGSTPIRRRSAGWRTASAASCSASRSEWSGTGRSSPRWR